MRDTVNEIGWDSPGTAFLRRENHVGEGFQTVEHDRVYTAVLGRVVDQVVGEKEVRHVVREVVRNARHGQVLEVLDTTLD